MAAALVWAVVAGVAPAQDLRYLGHQSWTTSDGLPQASVHAIAQTPDGFLWIATEGGLARYDGAQFAVYDRTSLPALPSNDLCCLTVAGDGTLWVGSGNGLAAIHDGHALALPAGIPFRDVAIISLATHGAAGVEVATGAGRFFVDAHGAHAMDDTAPPRRVPISSAAGVDASPWSATVSQVSLHKANATLTLTAGRELPAGRVQTVFVAQDAAWIAMSSGLVAIDSASRRVQTVPWFAGRSVLAIFEDREGDLWVGTETAGLHELARRAFRAIEGASDLGITALSETPQLGVVLGTHDGGLLSWRDGQAKPMHVAGLTADDTILCLGSAGGTLWAGTPHGLLRIDSRRVPRMLTSLEGLPDDSVRSVAAISATQAWVGTAHGLAFVDGDHIRGFGPQEGLGGDLVGALLPARGEPALRSGVWAATDGGLSLVSSELVVRTFGKTQGLTTPVVAAMAYDDAGRLWLATEDGWLWRLEGDRPHRVSQLVPRRARAQQVASITVAANTLWLQTSDGILSGTLDRLLSCGDNGCSDAARLLTPYGEGQGMPSAETLSLASGTPLLRDDGELWFPTRGGIAATTARITKPPLGVPVVLERILADDRELPVSEELALPYGRSRITVEFAGLSLRDPRAVRYRYRIEGFDRDWIEGGQRRFATYTAVPPGTYTFRVQAALEGQPWAREQATLLRITPPFYRSWWFVLLMLLGVAALLGAGYLYRLRLLRRRFAAVLAERNRLAREVHDTLAQDLVSTTIQLDLVMMQLSHRPLPESRADRALTQLRSLRKFVGEGLAEARQSIADLREGSVSLDLASRIRSIAAHNAATAAITRIEVEGRTRTLRPGVEREVARIVGEALTNAARHAQASEIVVTLRYLPQQLEVVVHDDGRGFSLDTQAREEGHFGLQGMRERAETLGAELEVESSPGAGTTVRLAVRDAESV